MELRRFDNIIAMKIPRSAADGDRFVGFHAHNLQVAQIDEAIWNSVADAAGEKSEAALEIAQWNQEQDPAASDAKVGQAIRSFAINVAQICNLKCTYCAAGGDGTFGEPMKQVDLTILFQQIKMFLDRVPSGESFKFTFLGGEPLIAPDAIRAIARFVKLQTAGRDIQIRYDIVTNGTLITPEIAELLASIAANVTISIDGPAEFNDLARPTKYGAGSTERTLRGIAELRKVKDRLGLLASGSIFGKHYTDVVGTYRFLRELGFDSMRFDFAAAEDDGDASQAYAASVCATADLAWQLGGEQELRRLASFDTYFRILDHQRRIQNHCGAGKNHMHSDTRGQLTTCQWFSGDKAEQIGQGARYDAAKLEDFADPLTEKHGCQSCWARNVCGGGCMFVNKTKTGSKHTKDREFCLRTRQIIAKGIEYYAEAR